MNAEEDELLLDFQRERSGTGGFRRKIKCLAKEEKKKKD